MSEPRTEPCPICGRTDGGHTPTKAERAELRRVKWRAFWRGFFTFGLAWRLDQWERP